MTDHLTDVLFAVPGVTSVRFPVSRLVLDPERFESDDREVMATKGMGVVYTHALPAATFEAQDEIDQRREVLIQGVDAKLAPKTHLEPPMAIRLAVR